MSFEQAYDNGVYKPYFNQSCNALLLQKASNQLVFQAAEAGNTMTVSCAIPASSCVLSIPDPGSTSASVQLSVGGSSSETKTRVLSISDSGKTLFIASAAAASSYTLPDPTTAGLRFQFIVTGSLSNAATITSSGANVQGLITSLDGTAFATNGVLVSSTNVILGTTSVVGDNLLFVSDGSKYWVQGQCSIHNSITRS